MLTFTKKATQSQAKNTTEPVSAVAVKRILRTVTGRGLPVKGVKVSPDGSFFIEIGQSANDPTNEPNPWDEVLPDGKA